MQVVVLSLALGLDNGVGRTPPQGFNPWNGGRRRPARRRRRAPTQAPVFGISAKGTCKLDYPWKECHGFNETVILEVARAIAATPLKQAGYGAGAACGGALGD